MSLQCTITGLLRCQGGTDLEYSGISLSMEKLREFCATSGKNYNKIVLVRLNICMKQPLTGKNCVVRYRQWCSSRQFYWDEMVLLIFVAIISAKVWLWLWKMPGKLWLFLSYFVVSDIAIFVLKRDVKLQLTNLSYFVATLQCNVCSFRTLWTKADEPLWCCCVFYAYVCLTAVSVGHVVQMQQLHVYRQKFLIVLMLNLNFHVLSVSPILCTFCSSCCWIISSFNQTPSVWFLCFFVQLILLSGNIVHQSHHHSSKFAVKSNFLKRHLEVNFPTWV